MSSMFRDPALVRNIISTVEMLRSNLAFLGKKKKNRDKNLIFFIIKVCALFILMAQYVTCYSANKESSLQQTSTKNHILSQKKVASKTDTDESYYKTVVPW